MVRPYDIGHPPQGNAVDHLTMRIDHKSPNASKYTVWHAPSNSSLNFVEWVDSDLLQWSHFLMDRPTIGGEVPRCLHKARRIDIFPKTFFIMIDAMDDLDVAEVSAPILLKAPNVRSPH